MALKLSLLPAEPALWAAVVGCYPVENRCVGLDLLLLCLRGQGCLAEWGGWICPGQRAGAEELSCLLGFARAGGKPACLAVGEGGSTSGPGAAPSPLSSRMFAPQSQLRLNSPTPPHTHTCSLFTPLWLDWGTGQFHVPLDQFCCSTGVGGGG